MKFDLNQIALQFILPLALALAPAAHAGTQEGKIDSIAARTSDGLLIIELTGAASQKPQCATHSYWMIKNENSTIGKQQLALLMAAQFSGKTVAIVGTGDCTRWRDGEDIEYVVVKTN